jgi:hypothetical protein
MQRLINIFLSVTICLLISINDQYGSRIQESLNTSLESADWLLPNKEYLSGNTDILFQEKVPDILGLPADKTLSELEIKNFQVRLSPRPMASKHVFYYIGHKQYFSRSKSIIPGLVSTSIGYPFHYFF